MKAIYMTLMVGAAAVVYVADAYAIPQQKEGSYFTNEAIRQAQNTQLIPPDATIQKVQEGIEVAVIEHVPDNQPINLHQVLRGHAPDEVINNLQLQVDQVGKS